MQTYSRREVMVDKITETLCLHLRLQLQLLRADQLLLTLMYWREYRTEFHIGLTYGVSEATVCRTVQKIENVLIQSQQFHLPGKKALPPSDTAIEVVWVDATEQPIERPEKNSASL